MKINIQENCAEIVNKQNHMASECMSSLQFPLYIVAILTYFEIFYVEMFSQVNTLSFSILFRNPRSISTSGLMQILHFDCLLYHRFIMIFAVMNTI